jgi:hypothetical protein
MSQTVDSALAEAEFYTDEQDYVLIRLPARAITAAAGVIAEIGEPFGALVVDKYEVTLLTYAGAAEEFQQRLHDVTISETTYRLITIDVVLEPVLTGFMARISTALADAGISILPYAAFSRDHILVPANQIEPALTTLEGLR